MSSKMHVFASLPAGRTWFSCSFVASGAVAAVFAAVAAIGSETAACGTGAGREVDGSLECFSTA